LAGLKDRVFEVLPRDVNHVAATRAGLPLKNKSTLFSMSTLPIAWEPGVILHPDRTRGISFIANGAHHVDAIRGRAPDGP
jgi:hypothetical protein